MPTIPVLGKCIEEGCGNQATRRHLCGRCYAGRRRRGEELPPKVSRLIPAPGYIAAHIRLGKASGHLCVVCKKQAKDWAYDKSDPNELTNPSNGRKYSLDPSRYSPMCRSCHIRNDRSETGKCMAGLHEWIPGDKQCQQCMKKTYKEMREIIKEAAGILGMGYKPYVAKYTSSKKVARKIIEDNKEMK